MKGIENKRMENKRMKNKGKKEIRILVNIGRRVRSKSMFRERLRC